MIHNDPWCPLSNDLYSSTIWKDKLVGFPVFCTRETTLVPSCYLPCITISFWKRVYSKRKEFTPTREQILFFYGRPLFRSRLISITKTCLYNFDPLKPHFYIVKLGFTGVYIIFLISAQNIDCGYSLEPPRRGGSNEYPLSMFWAEMWWISRFFIWKFSFFGGKIFSLFE